jgi:hypothetical protein
MGTIRKSLKVAEITTTAADTSYAPVANTRSQLTACTISNKTATPRYVTVTVDPTGADPARNLVYQRVIPANSSAALPEVIGHCLNPLDAILFLAEANSALDLVLSGYETS